MSLTGIGLIAIPISAATACGLSFGNKITYEIIINKDNNYKKQFENDQQTNKLFDKLCRKAVQVNVIVRNEYESHCNIFTQYLEEKK